HFADRNLALYQKGSWFIRGDLSLSPLVNPAAGHDTVASTNVGWTIGMNASRLILVAVLFGAAVSMSACVSSDGGYNWTEADPANPPNDVSKAENGKPVAGYTGVYDHHPVPSNPTTGNSHR